MPVCEFHLSYSVSSSLAMCSWNFALNFRMISLQLFENLCRTWALPVTVVVLVKFDIYDFEQPLATLLLRSDSDLRAGRCAIDYVVQKWSIK